MAVPDLLCSGNLKFLQIVPPYRALMQYAIGTQPVFGTFKTSRAKLQNHTQISFAQVTLL